MFNNLLQIIAPHHCYGCSKTGPVLCDNCKYDIVDETISSCIVCGSPTMDGICGSCRTSYAKAWYVGNRTGPLMAVIDGLKFKNVKDAAKELAALLDARLPVLPPNTVLVPVPTIPSHIRQRGYDHVLLIAKALAARRNIAVKQLLTRNNHDVQRGKSKKERIVQARSAFACAVLPDNDTPYLVIDDVVTTNATLEYAAKTLKAAGATTVWACALARQPLDQDK